MIWKGVVVRWCGMGGAVVRWGGMGWCSGEFGWYGRV